MSIKDKIMGKMGNDAMNVIKSLNDNMKVLEQHMVVMTENQVEFEKYLKDIKKSVEELNKE
jgi:hypothetical protein